ncbi:glutamyl-tRNA reductase [Chloroflexota bacterium]
MHLIVVGINHHTAPVGLREKASVRTSQIDDTLRMLKSYINCSVVLSTCNRTEIYSVESSDYKDGSRILNFLESYFGMPREELAEHAYHCTDRDVAKHLFRVAGGLDSMIIGEFEVLGQVKSALDYAENAGVVNLPLRRLFQDAIRTGRRVREKTGISKNALSVSSVAMELAAGAVGDLSQKKMLLIGAGEAGRLVAQAARDRGTCHIKVASRTFKRATALACELEGSALSFEKIIPELETSDLIITCADAPHTLITPTHVARALQNRNGDPIVIVDIAVPRNVAPEVGEMERVFLYNIDDLNSISEKNRRVRESEKEKADILIGAEVDKFNKWWQTFSMRPVITALMNKANRIRTSQLDKTLKKLPPLNDEERYSLEKMTEAIVAKLLKDPISILKENTGGNGDLAGSIRHLFRLENEESDG